VRFNPDRQRLHTLLERLETRARQFPGLFPVESRQHWLSLACLMQNRDYAVSDQIPIEDCARLWPLLEEWNHSPIDVQHVVNALLADVSTDGPVLTSPDGAANRRERQRAIETLLSRPLSTCHSRRLKSA